MNFKNVAIDLESKQATNQDVLRLEPSDIKYYEWLFRFLSEKDKDILYLLYLSGCKQKNIMRILRKKQSSINYDFGRMKNRLSFIYYLTANFETFTEFLEKEPDFLSAYERDILVLMFYTTSLTKTAKILSEQQMKIQYLFDKILGKLMYHKEWDVFEIFMSIRTRFNLVKRGNYVANKVKVS